MSRPPKPYPILGLKSLFLALLLEAGLFVGLAQVLEPQEAEASLHRNLAWVPEDHAERIADEQKEPEILEPKERYPIPPTLPLPIVPLREEPLPPLPAEKLEPKSQPRLLPFSPDPLDSPSLTREFSRPSQAERNKTPTPKTTSPTLPSKAQTKTLSPVEGWNPKPPYPVRAIRLGQEGSVQLELRIDEKGRVQNIRVLRGSGSPLLDLVSRKTLATWRYDGGPGRVRERVVFRLVGGEAGVVVGKAQDGGSPNPRSRK